MYDPTENARRQRMAELISEACTARAELEAKHGPVYSTEELRERFEVLGFLAPFVVAREKASGKKGSLEFQASPRYYFNWQEDK